MRKGVALRLLLVQPFGEIARRAAARYDREAILVQTLANGGTNAPMPPVTYATFFAHL